MKIDRYGRAEILRSDDIQKLFGAGFEKPRDRALFGVCLYAAARINEACSLLRRDVMGKGGIRETLLLRSSITKGKRWSREINVHPQLREYLEEYVKGGFPPANNYLFPGRRGKGHIHPGSAAKILRDVCVELGLEGVSTHSFRRTALTRMSDAGIPLRHIQEISGHKDLYTLSCYLGVTEKHKQRAISALEF